MSGHTYDEEHNINRAEEQAEAAARESKRPDLSSFWSLKKETFGDEPVRNPHAEPEPGNLTAMSRMLADSFEQTLARIEVHGDLDDLDRRSQGLLRDMISQLDAYAMDPKGEGGLPETFFADLDRVNKKDLKKDDACPICTERFLDDPYPLVVRLPCHRDHIFDLECIQSWLTLKSTCPIDRKSFAKKKVPKPIEDDEEDYDDQFG